MENRKNQKSSAENRKKHLCRKLENDIFKSRKPGKYGGNRKAQFKIRGNRKSGSCGKAQKDNEKLRKSENQKKATESRKR